MIGMAREMCLAGGKVGLVAVGAIAAARAPDGRDALPVFQPPHASPCQGPNEGETDKAPKPRLRPSIRFGLGLGLWLGLGLGLGFG